MLPVVFEHTAPNSEWDISASVLTETISSISTVKIIMILTRKPEFLVLNLLLPTLLISAVNSLSFVIPIESGERLSYGISMLLTFIVFLTTILDHLPSSDSISHFNVFVFLQLVYSSLVVFGIAKTLQYYQCDKDDEVPEKIKTVVKFLLRRNRCEKIFPDAAQRRSIVERFNKMDITDTLTLPPEKSSDTENLEDGQKRAPVTLEDRVTWKDVAQALDKILNIFSKCGTLIVLLVSVIVIVKCET